jgi:hypothetical protein
MMEWEYEYDDDDEDEKMRRLAAVRSLVRSGRLADLTNVDPESFNLHRGDLSTKYGPRIPHQTCSWSCL